MTRLEVELVPKTCFFKNLRSELKKADWDTLRKATYNACNYRCEICGGKGSKWPVEAHEIFKYDDKDNVQTLIGLEGLCPSCHSVKHFGHTQLQGGAEAALEHMAKVNGWEYQKCIGYLELVFAKWEERSQKEWTQDLSFLKKLGVEPPKAEPPKELYGTNPLSAMSRKIRGVEPEEEVSLDAQDDLWFD